MVTAGAGRLNVGSPFFAILLFILDFEFIGYPLALKFPVVLVDCRMNDLLVLVDDCSSDLFFIVEIIFFHDICLFDHLLVVVASTSGFIIALLLSILEEGSTCSWGLRILGF